MERKVKMGGAYNEVISNYIGNTYLADCFEGGETFDSLFGKKRKTAAGKAAAIVASAPIAPLAIAGKLGKKILKAKKNKKTAKRLKKEASINEIAKLENKPAEDVALTLMQQPQTMQQVQQYVTSKGEVPLSNPAELATQAYVMRNDDVQNIAETLGVPEDDAEAMLEDVEDELEEDGNAEAENFLGEALAILKPIAQKGIAKIAAKKQAKGKTKGLFQTLNKKLNGGATPDQIPGGNVADAVDELKRQEKAKEIKKMLPMIIGGVVALIVIVFLIARSTKK